MKLTKGKKKAVIRWRAKTLLEVVKETGVLNITEGHRRCFKNQTEKSHSVNAGRDMATSEIMEEFTRLLNADDKAVSRLKPDDIVKELLNDLNRINTMIEGGELGPEDLAKFLRLKDAKLKLLGMKLGMWQEDKPQDVDNTNPDKLFERFSGYGGLN